jgi:thiamine pyrophosphate-dependent acetolactate synthase large subunit-like protein
VGGQGLRADRLEAAGRVRPAHGPLLRRVEKSAELRATLERAFEEDGPSLVAIPIDYRENQLLSERLGRIACPI